ncbi:MAG: response regulator transcription factor [Lentisphaeraceae bacterium]|nr:response regulator transcription factor [Lentisphaeraceae bacterium]
MKLLIIEDDRKTAGFVKRGFEEDGWSVCVATDGPEGLATAVAEPPDVAIVDVMLPGLSGLEVIRTLRNRRATFPILILSARDAVEDKVHGLELGADDYLAKPFSLSELVARIQALLRRATSQHEQTRLQVGSLVLDRLTRTVTRDGQPIELQRLEFLLLEYLMRNRGRVVSKSTIIEHVWGYDFNPGTNVVEARVCRLREKVDKAFEPKLIRTVKGFGYVLG